VEVGRLSADCLLLLGPLQVFQNGSPQSQPPSRKVLALLAYLARAARPVSREKLCELLWDVADDPRRELRWCLTKLRPLINGTKAIRLIADREQVHIDTNLFDVDGLLVARRTQTTLNNRSPSSLRSLLALFVPW
jgi:DNA-binding SARP family transcriptional activator